MTFSKIHPLFWWGVTGHFLTNQELVIQNNFLNLSTAYITTQSFPLNPSRTVLFNPGPGIPSGIA